MAVDAAWTTLLTASISLGSDDDGNYSSIYLVAVRIDYDWIAIQRYSVLIEKVELSQ